MSILGTAAAVGIAAWILEEGENMTTAAERFLDGVSVAWDHAECWTETAAWGLAEPDTEALAAYCRDSGEEYATAEQEVLEVVRERANRIAEKFKESHQ